MIMQQPIPASRIHSLRQKMKENGGWTDEELDSLTPKQWMFLDGQHKFRHYKVIAEVARINDHCNLQPKIGDKYVFNGGAILVPEESTFPGICIWALAGIAPLTYMIIDRILADLDPNDIWRNQATCMDASIRSGGLGEVVFKIYCEKV